MQPIDSILLFLTTLEEILLHLSITWKLSAKRLHKLISCLILQIDLMDTLLDIEIANAVMKDADKLDESDPVYKNYKSLKVRFSHVVSNVCRLMFNL